MVELQSCASLVNASSLCAIEKDMKGEGIGAVAEISAELQREKLRNAELVERVSMLEAQIQERDKDPLPADEQGSCEKTEAERRLKKFKRQKIEAVTCGREDGSNIKREMEPQVMHDTQCMAPKNKRVEDGFVNWMSMEDNQFLHIEKTEDGDFTVECDDTDDSDDEDHYLYGEDDVNIDHKDRKIDDNQGTADKVQEQVHEECVDDGLQIPLESSSGVVSKLTLLYESQERNDNQKNDGMLSYSQLICDKRESRKYVKETKKIGESEATTGSRSIAQNKKPPKVAFCPKEIKRIMESEELLLKNAQSHTIRKIIVFASLGIRDGCEDMYDLDFNHFSILRKEEPYISPQNPGEHVLYENSGGRRKIFYPNRQNPTLCPVKILEEEKDMRPFDASCPSCLFLCIKYGGRTRNLPQNEYVRQRMGRNKLKSFGPVMCRMAMLANIRNGSFFFKSLGITLLFMAGFPDDLVQRETKYRNLDLLQKYYRTDKDTEGEELFLPHPLNHHETASPGPQQLGTKTTSTKPKGKKQINSTSKPQNLTKPSIQQPAPSRSALLSPLGPMSYNCIHSHAMAAFQSLSSQTQANNPIIPNTLITSSDTNVSFRHQTPYHLYPPQPTNAFMPMMFWPPPNTFPPSPYSSSYGYRSLPYTGNYLSLHPQPYYNHFSSTSLVPNMEEGTGKNNVAAEESDSDSNSSSNNSEQRLTQTSCKR